MNLRKISAIIILLFLLIFLPSNMSNAAKTTTTKPKACTHRIYSTGSPSTYHYSYCSKCGECNGRTVHSVSSISNYGSGTYHRTFCSCGEYLGLESHSYHSFSQYNDTYHQGRCSCGYVGLLTHNGTPRQISRGEVIKGVRYSTTEQLDTYHKSVCVNCSEVLGVQEHTWSGGSTSTHRCSGCSYEHSKKNDATLGRHYFNIETIRIMGDVAPCEVCGEYLKLSYSTDTRLTKLPKKEEYTMVGNPNPMKEVSISTNQKIKLNFMPINEKGELIKLEELFLRVRTYTHGSYYRHYSKLMSNQLSNITERVEYLQESGLIDYMTTKLSELGALGGYNDEKKAEIVNELNQMVKDDPSLGWIDTYAVATVISQLGDFAIDSIRAPLLEWFSRGLAIRDTWLGGSVTTIRQEFFGNMYNSSGREFVLYFTELPPAKYEILMSPLLTYGVNFNLFSYSLGGATQMIFSTLFNIGSPASDAPSDIKAYISIAYRDTNGNVIYNKGGNLATPIDTIISKIVYSGTSARTISTNISAEMGWTQLTGYRYKGYLVKYRQWF